jgi:prepilin-type N-terminal cleavage/methylation domain-containing protein
MMKKLRKTKAFTLLEIMIVVIIVGVLASLALPKFFSLVEYSRATEAFNAIAMVRSSMERYYVMKGTFVGVSLANIDSSDPLSGQPNAHFSISFDGLSATGYSINAWRNTRDGGDTAARVSVMLNAGVITRSGTTAFAGIN